jgi:hypothetical protein
MDIGLIFRTGDPLDRTHYVVGSIIVYLVGGAIFFLFVSGLLSSFVRSLEGATLLFLPLLLYLIAFRIRRVVDIGFASWKSASLAMLGYAGLAYFAGTIHPAGQITVVACFELALLLMPTGANIRKSPKEIPW